MAPRTALMLKATPDEGGSEERCSFAGAKRERLSAVRLPISVLAVDEHPLFREGIAAVLSLEPDIEMVAEAQSAAEGVSLYRKHRPDVVLMDVKLADGSGIDATAQIRQEFPGAKVIMLTSSKGDIHALNALKAGASGFLLKNVLRRELVQSIRTVHRGEQCILEEVARELAMHAADESLSAREIGVLGLVAQGQSNKRIARTLGIAEETVKTHMTSVLAKLKANDRTHAVLIGMKRGIIQLQ